MEYQKIINLLDTYTKLSKFIQQVKRLGQKIWLK